MPAIADILSQLQFKHGWGVLEANNSPFELYSPNWIYFSEFWEYFI